MKRTLLLLFVVVFTQCLIAQTADDIVAKAIAARGGLDRIKGVQTERFTGRISFGPGQEGTLIATWKRPGKFRQELVLGGNSIVRATDGATGWTLSSTSGARAEALPPDQMRGIAEQSDFDKPLVDFKAKGNQVELVGKEKLDGRDAYKLKVTLKDGQVRYEWIDAETYLESRWQGKVSVGGGNIEFATTFSDYRTVDGLKFAFLLNTETVGTDNRQKITLEKVEVNAPVDDAAFRMPASPPASSAK